MVKMVLTNVREFHGQADLTESTNKVEVTSNVQTKDTTTYGSGGWKEFKGGIFSTEIKDSGFFEAGFDSAPDDTVWAALGSATLPYTVGPTGATDGALAYLTRALRKKHGVLEGSIGDVAGWSGELTGSWPMVRGAVAHPPGTARTADGDGTGVNLGTVTAAQHLYACLHVLSVSGTLPEITVAVESAPDNTFASPTTMLTFAPASAPGGQALRVPGSASGDTWWRATWTITGTLPSFLFLASFGVHNG
jgi:hypothetical protein